MLKIAQCFYFMSLSSCQIVALVEWVWQHYDDIIDRVLAYHIQLCTFSILQDTTSQDWTNTKPFFEVVLNQMKLNHVLV